MGQIFYIPHGGGPLPLLGDPGYARLSQMLQGLGSAIGEHKAAIVVTAHWEAEHVSLSSAAQPPMLFDYYGFPDEAYRLRYDAPGAPELADVVKRTLNEHGLECELTTERGYDHGTFVPMMLMRPQADIPVLQMSLLASLDPAAHIDVGRALGQLAQDNVAIIGSGFSFHNLAALTGRLGPDISEGQAQARAFHDWLEDVICAPSLTAQQRSDALAAWAEAPGARFCHPREEHLLPLHVCYGAAEAAGFSPQVLFNEAVKGYHTVGYQWR